MKPTSPLGAPNLPAPIAAFLREIEPFCGAEMMAPLCEALAAIDDEANENEDAEKLVLVISRIVGQARPLAERLQAVSDVLAQRGHVTVTITRNTVEIEGRQS
jgi:hypothetical protein